MVSERSANLSAISQTIKVIPISKTPEYTAADQPMMGIFAGRGIRKSKGTVNTQPVQKFKNRFKLTSKTDFVLMIQKLAQITDDPIASITPNGCAGFNGQGWPCEAMKYTPIKPNKRVAILFSFNFCPRNGTESNTNIIGQV